MVHREKVGSKEPTQPSILACVSLAILADAIGAVSLAIHVHDLVLLSANFRSS